MRLPGNLPVAFWLAAIIIIACSIATKPKLAQTETFITAPVSVKLNHSWIPQQPAPTKLTVQGDAPFFGIFDPSLEYDQAGVGWMSYSAVTPPTPPDRVSTHLARSEDKGATWRFVAEINPAANETITIGGAPASGIWQHEVSTIVCDPGDPHPQRRWKLYWHEYFATANDRKFVTHGWIAVRYAPQPQGPWSPRVRLFGGPQTDTANYPVVMNLSALHPSLNSCLAYSEPGSMVVDGDLYISLLCAQGPPATNKNVLIRSRDHGQRWELVATLADPADATALGEINFSASDLVRQGDKFYLMLTPLRSRGGPEPAYSGCHFFEFTHLASGRLKRDAQGRLVSALYIEGDPNRFRGACGYDQRNTGGGILLSELHLEATDRFEIFNTNRMLVGNGALPDTEAPIVSQVSLSKKKVNRNLDATLNISWASQDNAGVIAHDVLFAADGAAFSAITAGLPGSEQSFTWTVPDSFPKTGTGRIKIIARDAAGNAGEAVAGKLKIK